METQERILGGVLGLAVGDALGVPVEFSERNALRRKPVTGMQGGGYHRQPAGTWWTAALARVEEIRERAGRLHRLCVAAPAFADSYWILPGKLLAGEYPGARKAEEAERKLKSLQETGVNFVVDLTEEGERADGAPLLLYHGLLDHRCKVARCLLVPLQVGEAENADANAVNLALGALRISLNPNSSSTDTSFWAFSSVRDTQMSISAVARG